MKKQYLFTLFIFVLSLSFIVSCSKNDDEEYVAVSPVVVDLTQVPYPKLSDYKFFEGDLKNQTPSLNVLPYEPSSSLFTDYAHKKRFVWMPTGTKANFDGDDKVLDLPIGAALIKTFYYDNVQNISPVGGTRIIETRIMIRKESGWIFAEYIWNAEQTDAFLDTTGDGSYTQIEWKDENNIIKNTNYRMPSEEQCIVCHKTSRLVNSQVVTTYIPIGIKPQNLNFNYSYTTTTQNQLTKWIEQGYLEDNFTLPTVEKTTVNYNDSSQSLDKRARSYVDINCAHCHQSDRHCDYRPMRFAFNETDGNQTNMGVCVETQDMQGFPGALGKIVTPANINRSMLFHRINTTNETYRMPLHGRTIIHEEGVALIQEWINSLQPCN